MFDWQILWRFDWRILWRILSFRPVKLKSYNGKFGYFTRAPNGIINALRFLYFYCCYQWAKPDGPNFLRKIGIRILDHLFGQFYRVNKNQIRRTSNSSSILSKKQNIEGFQSPKSVYEFMYHYNDSTKMQPLKSFILERTRK